MAHKWASKTVVDRTLVAKHHPFFPRGFAGPLPLKTICAHILLKKAAKKANRAHAELMKIPQLPDDESSPEPIQPEAQQQPQQPQQPQQQSPQIPRSPPKPMPALIPDVEAIAAHERAFGKKAESNAPPKEPPTLPAVLCPLRIRPIGLVDGMTERSKSSRLSLMSSDLPHDLINYLKDRAWLPKVPVRLRVEKSMTLRDLKVFSPIPSSSFCFSHLLA